MHGFGTCPKCVHRKWDRQQISLLILTIFGRCHAIFALELLAQVSGREAHLSGDGRDRHYWFIVKQTKRLFQSDVSDILREGETICVLSQQVVECVATDIKMVADILTLQIDVGIETLAADGGVDFIELRPFDIRY